MTTSSQAADEEAPPVWRKQGMPTAIAAVEPRAEMQRIGVSCHECPQLVSWVQGGSNDAANIPG